MSVMARERKKPVPRQPAKITAGTVEIPTAAQVKAIRTKLGLSQEQAAARIGMSRRTWQDYERGEIDLTTSAALLIRLLEAGKI